MKTKKNQGNRNFILKNAIVVMILFLFIDSFASVLYFKFAEVNLPPVIYSKVDVGVVFSHDSSIITPEAKRRLNHAMILYKNGKIGNILCVGGGRSDKSLKGSKLMSEYLLDRGIPSDYVFYDQHSNDTLSNINEAIRIIGEKKFNSVVLISSRLHLYRMKILLLKNKYKNIRFKYEPYSYNDSKPPTNYASLWIDIHHEWIALALNKVLPARTYRNLVDWLRGANKNSEKYLVVKLSGSNS